MLLASAFIAVASLMAAASGAQQLAEPRPSATDVPFMQRVQEALAKESRDAGVPERLSEIVVRIESGFDPNAIGTVGEIGLMQVRPGTAAMLGFHGNLFELARPETNVHYGVAYLASAWRLTGGDLCRTLMKYRAGLGEEVFTPKSIDYCNRAKALLTTNTLETQAPVQPSALRLGRIKEAAHTKALSPIAAVYRRFKRGTPAASQAFWRLEMARVRAIKARIEARWHLRHVSSAM